MTNEHGDLQATARRLRWPVRLTHLGLLSERLTRAFWPLWSLVFVAFSAIMLGLHEVLTVELTWVTLVLYPLALLVALVMGLRRFRWPTLAEAMARVDRTLPGRPIAALADTQAIGAADAASVQVWQAHVARMAQRVSAARPVAPDLRISDRDPYALRYLAVLALAVGLLFGSILKVTTVEAALPGRGVNLATGPSWEGWAEPPAYTGKPSLYLNDIKAGRLRVPKGSRITLRLYGEVGDLTIAENVSGRIADTTSPAEPSQSFDVVQPGTITIDGTGGAKWDVVMEPDNAPTVQLSAQMERTVAGEMRQPFIARDDYGVVSGKARITLDLASADRRYGRVLDPEPREPIVLDLPMPISGSRTSFEETLVENLSKHAWSGLPVDLILSVQDDLEQTGDSAVIKIDLPGRRFFNPLANAIIEQRSDLLWSRQNTQRTAGLLRAVSYKPEGFISNNTAYLKLRVTLRRMETLMRVGKFDAAARDETAEALWDVALSFEDGRLTDALERLRRAQDRLAEAMRQGASDQEIAELMQDLRDAMQDYMRQLAQENDQQNQDQQLSQNQQEITGDQLEEMLKRLQELMEQGRMAEAQALLDQLRQMMENMQVTQGQQGQGQQGPGEQAMQGLQETLRNQQGLSDEAFRDLQEQFNPGAQAGQSDQNQGRNGSQGQGQQHEGQGQGQGQSQGEGQGQNQGQRQGQNQGQNQGQGGGQQPNGQNGEPGGLAQSLADRQQALRGELGRQAQNLPGAGTPEGDAARDALGRAGRAMDGAEEALRGDDLPGALDKQAQAMEALREGMRNLGEAMAQNQQNGDRPGEQGLANGQDSPGARDPLGREAGATGRVGSDENLLQGEDVYRRAEELLDEIRRRSGEQGRPEIERDYLKRLLDRF